ncbi:hypothetical protein WM24_23740 [Burkholderia ubonensis]|uniref:hypothetical protein n=1 Tax=Burkholderia ubonensis TaxID=101571 RepID=UPI00075D974A|nr:hypothetical protein [Burkholderia ubonensis]KWN80852.1 hypothetical protein WM24_23740 [Burkholderia ubonensis]
MTNDCPRAGRWIGGCKFEVRYDLIPLAARTDLLAPYQSIMEIEARTKRIYVADVCTRCGKVVKREAT